MRQPGLRRLGYQRQLQPAETPCAPRMMQAWHSKGAGMHFPL